MLMAHPIEGFWKVVVSFEDPASGVQRDFKTAQRFTSDGTVIVDAGIFVGIGIWEAVDAKTAKTKGVRPIVTGTMMEREFHGWQEAEGTFTVDDSGDVFTSEATFVVPAEDGTEMRGTATTRGERVTFG